MTSSPSIPLFEEVVNGFHKLSVSGDTKKESSDLRRTRQQAFDKFRELGFPSIRHEDWRYTNLARFLKDEFTIEGWEVAGRTALPDAALLKKAAELGGLSVSETAAVVMPILPSPPSFPPCRPAAGRASARAGRPAPAALGWSPARTGRRARTARPRAARW